MRTACTIRVAAWCFTALVTLAGCSKPKQPEPEPKATAEIQQPATPPQAHPHQSVGAAQPTGAAQEELGVQWTDPAGWKRVKPQSPMRKASYEVPGEGGAAELSVFYFGPDQGGSTDANIDRWVAQFIDVKPETAQRSERVANDLKQHIVEIKSGTYQNTMAMQGSRGPQANHALLGAVIEAPSGKYFFKMTGPSSTVEAAREDFFKLLDSMQVRAQ